MPFDLKEWFKEIGLDSATQAIIEPHLSKADVLAKVQSSVMRTPDYKAKMDAVDKLKADLVARDKELDADYARLGAGRAEIDKAFQKAVKERNAIATQAVAIKKKLEAIAIENGIDVASLELPDIDAVDAGKPAAGGGNREPVDTSNFLTKSDLGLIGRTVMTAMEASGEIIQLDQTHRELFGKALPNPKNFMKEYLAAAADAGKNQRPEPTMEQFFNTKFNVEARRTEMSEADIEARVKRLVEERLIAERSNATSGLSIDDAANKPGGSPILKKKADFKPLDQLNRDPNRGVARAIAGYDENERQLLRGGTAA